ncbi:hypothetical protein EDD17DRAFT_1512315 [Pisolithus thermaeus]|nr:hypothetical protein EDD17DRAFT_1512315 [Pisolithus thermaeus]
MDFPQDLLWFLLHWILLPDGKAFRFMLLNMALARNAQNGLQEHLTLAVEAYQSSGVHTKVSMLIQTAFQKYGEDVETLCPILVNIAEENQLCMMVNFNFKISHSPAQA